MIFAPKHTILTFLAPLFFPKSRYFCLRKFYVCLFLYKNIIKEDNPTIVIENKLDYGKYIFDTDLNGYCFRKNNDEISGLLELTCLQACSKSILNSSEYTHFKHALEWNYFLGVITFYLLTFLFWKKID